MAVWIADDLTTLVVAALEAADSAHVVVHSADVGLDDFHDFVVRVAAR